MIIPCLEPIKLPFILSGVCSPSEANYCSNPFEVLSKALSLVRGCMTFLELSVLSNVKKKRIPEIFNFLQDYYSIIVLVLFNSKLAFIM